MNGVGGSCVYCTQRNGTFGASADKTQMYSTAEGWRGLGPGYAVINGMHSTDGCQAIRMTSSEGGTRSILIVRNSTFEGNAQGPRFGGKMDDKPPTGKMGAFCLFENNYSTESKNGCGGARIGEGIHMIIRGNTFEGCTGNGIMLYTTGAYLRIEGNLFKDNALAAIDTETSDPCDTKIDLGGGLADVWEIDPAGAFYGASAAARAAAPSCGQNTFQNNGGGIDVVNRRIGTPQVVLKAENNFWKYTSGGQVLTRTSVAEVLANDVSGNVDVDPLGVDPNSP
jgi:hypothetical protein